MELEGVNIFSDVILEIPRLDHEQHSVLLFKKQSPGAKLFRLSRRIFKTKLPKNCGAEEEKWEIIGGVYFSDNSVLIVKTTAHCYHVYKTI